VTTVPSRLFCDTSFFYASLDPRDVNHRKAQMLLAAAAVQQVTFAATWDIISETVTLLRYRRNFKSAAAFLADVKPGLLIPQYGDQVRAEAEHIFLEYGRDHKLSFCDAISFVVVTTLLGGMPCLAFDEDFRALGLTVLT